MPPKKDVEAAHTDLDDPTSISPDGISTTPTTHSREKLKLCQQVVLDHFGPLAAKVSSILLERGRLTLREIERFVAVQHQSSVSLICQPTPARSQVLHAILALVQHNCLYHVRLDLDGTLIKDPEEPGGTEYYELSPDAVLTRTRFGRYLQLAEQLWGLEGLEVTTLVLQNGKMQVADLLRQMPSNSSSTRPLITHMLLSAYLSPVALMSHLSPHDVRLAYVNEQKRSVKGIPTAQNLRDVEAAVRARLTKEREQSWNLDRLLRYEIDGGGLQARALEVDKRHEGKKKTCFSKSSRSLSSKRRKLAVEGEGSSIEDDSKGRKHGSFANANGSIAGHDDERSKYDCGGSGGLVNGAISNGRSSSLGDKKWMESLTECEKDRLDKMLVDESVFIRANYDRFDVHIRNEVLRDLVALTFNETAADVYSAILDAAQARSRDVGSWPSVSDQQSEAVSLTVLASTLPASINLSRGFDKNMFVKISRCQKPSRYDFISEYVAVLSRVEDIMASREKRFKALTSSSEVPNFQTAIRFLVSGTGSGSADTTTVAGSRISSAVAVDFQSAGRKLKWNLLKRTVQDVFGDNEARVLSIMRKEGRVDEKHISKLALMSLPDTREACSRLFSNSLISLQEVPKGADRNPQRTFFLYFLDYPRALAWLSDHLYKTQGRLAQRREWERERERALLKKIERTDVQTEGVENVLTTVERERLRRCRDRLRLLTVEEQRVERESWILSRMRG